MAMSTDKKLFIALGAVVVLGGVFFMQKRAAREEEKTYSLEGQQAALPKLGITKEKTDGFDKIVIEKPKDADGGAPEKIVLEKKGEDWRIVEPVQASANQTNVKTLLEALPKLEVKEVISTSKDAYGKHKLTDAEALHFVAMKGTEKVVDLYFGEGGSRGNMTRIAGKDGVYSVKGYSSYQFNRDLKSWRDRTIFKFESEKVAKVEIENENGAFSFEKKPDAAPPEPADAGASKSKPKAEWIAKYKKPKTAGFGELAKFDMPKVEDLLRAYKTLNAVDFGDGKAASDVGLDAPVATIAITLDDGARRVLKVGATSESTNRWAVAEGDGQVYSISSYVSGWAMADADKFRKPEDREKKDDKKAGSSTPSASPPGMPDLGSLDAEE